MTSRHFLSLFSLTRSVSTSSNMALVSSYLTDTTNVQNEINAGSSPKKAKLSTSVEEGLTLQVKKLTDLATVPTRGSQYAAGYDLYSAYDVLIPAQAKALVKTDIAIAVPQGCYGRVAPRSSLAWKHHIDVGAGVIDYDYRGNVGVVLFNLGADEYQVKKGDRIAQLVLERIFTPPVLEVEALDETQRGAGGYGSTGK